MMKLATPSVAILLASQLLVGVSGRADDSQSSRPSATSPQARKASRKLNVRRTVAAELAYRETYAHAWLNERRRAAEHSRRVAAFWQAETKHRIADKLKRSTPILSQSGNIQWPEVISQDPRFRKELAEIDRIFSSSENAHWGPGSTALLDYRKAERKIGEKFRRLAAAGKIDKGAARPLATTLRNVSTLAIHGRELPRPGSEEIATMAFTDR